MMEVLNELMSGGADWITIDTYNDHAAEYNEICATPGSGRPKLPIIPNGPLPPGSGDWKDWFNNSVPPIPPLIPGPRHGGGSGSGGGMPIIKTPRPRGGGGGGIPIGPKPLLPLLMKN